MEHSMRSIAVVATLLLVVHSAIAHGQVRRKHTFFDETVGPASLSVSASSDAGIEIVASDPAKLVLISGPCPKSLLLWADSTEALAHMALTPAKGEELQVKTGRVRSIGGVWFERSVSAKASEMHLVFNQGTYSVILVPVSEPVLRRFLNAIRQSVPAQLELSKAGSFFQTCKASLDPWAV
jgi:hypothetical protein